MCIPLLYTPKYERLLIVCDFNIHVCCDSSALAKDFVNLMEACDFVQWANEPTHVHGHILDLVLSHGFPISDVQIGDLSFSDHRPVVFSVDLSCHTIAPVRPVKWSRVGLSYPASAEVFSVAFF